MLRNKFLKNVPLKVSSTLRNRCVQAVAANVTALSSNTQFSRLLTFFMHSLTFSSSGSGLFIFQFSAVDLWVESTKGAKLSCIQDEKSSLAANGFHHTFNNVIRCGVDYIDGKSAAASPSRHDSVSPQSMEKKPIRFFTAGVWRSPGGCICW